MTRDDRRAAEAGDEPPPASRAPTCANAGAWARGARTRARERGAARVRAGGAVQRQRVRRDATNTDRARTSSCGSSAASALGIVAFAIAAKFDAEQLRDWAWPIMWLTIAAMMAVLVLPGRDRADASTARGASSSARRSSRRSSASSPSSSGSSMLIVKKGDSAPPLDEGAGAVPRRDRRARRARRARAGPVGGDAVHAAHGAAAVRRRRAHGPLHRARRDVPAARAGTKIEKLAVRAVAPHGVLPSRATRPRR